MARGMLGANELHGAPVFVEAPEGSDVESTDLD
jgi:hypothetical protein